MDSNHHQVVKHIDSKPILTPLHGWESFFGTHIYTHTLYV